MPERKIRESDQWAAYGRRFGVNLQATRLARGLSQEQVAYAAGLSRYTYQKYEKGESKPGQPANPTLRTLIALAQVLAVDVEDLLPDQVPDLRLR